MTHTKAAGHRATTAAILGAILSAVRNHGDIGGYGVICFVGGVAYALCLFILKRRS